MTTELRKINFAFSITWWMISTFIHLSNIFTSVLFFFPGLVSWRSIVQVKGQLSDAAGLVPTALFMMLNVGEPLHFIYTSSMFLRPGSRSRLMCARFPGVSPGFSGDPSVIPEERGVNVSPKTTPTDTDTDLSIWKSTQGETGHKDHDNNVVWCCVRTVGHKASVQKGSDMDLWENEAETGVSV